MIAGIIQEALYAEELVETIQYIAAKLGKQALLAILAETDIEFERQQEKLSVTVNRLCTSTIETKRINNISQTTTFCESNEVSMLFIQQLKSSKQSLQKTLTACRDLRIPYSLYKENHCLKQIESVIVPVGFLEEELEKAQFAGAFGRYCNSEIKLLQANDYGSKASINTDRILEFLAKFNLTVHHIKAQKDSFKVDFEALSIAEDSSKTIVLITASRDYGLDDLLFGPRELKLIKKSSTPLLLINPRGDLYALCD